MASQAAGVEKQWWLTKAWYVSKKEETGLT
jgi:hypothetical protein